jgi:hypothetical protein
MNMQRVAEGEHWMDAEERLCARDLVERLAAQFDARGVVETPLLALRVNDLVVSLLLVRRIESQLAELPECPESEKPNARSPATLAEAVGKARERMRKAMKELEDSCAKLGTPIDRGLADALRPIMLQGRGVDDVALEETPATEEPSDLEED